MNVNIHTIHIHMIARAPRAGEGDRLRSSRLARAWLHVAALQLAVRSKKPNRTGRTEPNRTV